MINTSNLRKNNWVRTEFGINRVAYVIWQDVYVYGKDNRVNYAREVEGLGIGEIDLSQIDKDLLREVLQVWLCVHEFQNWYYWKTGKELDIDLSKKGMTGFDILIDSMKRTGECHTKTMNDIKKQLKIE